MQDAAIQVESLGKRYLIPQQREKYRTLRDAVARAAAAPWRRLRSVLRGQAPRDALGLESVWALRNVSFEVAAGQVVGVIGLNGSGKSTLLKVLSRITAPTEGRARVVGRVGSLLEVGTGFHFELSGRDNIFLSGATLGMRRAEIEAKFDEIVAFSQIGRYLDAPVKHYSSGMYMRLAFSVAAHLESEILLVDEVLAVGDQDFQKKCIEKMREMTRSGRTVLFVSHNLDSIRSLCHSAVLLRQGTLAAAGPVEQVVAEYLPAGPRVGVGRVHWDDPAVRPANEWIELHWLRLESDDGRVAAEFAPNEPVLVRIGFFNRRSGSSHRITLVLRDEAGHAVLVASSDYCLAPAPVTPPGWALPEGLHESTCRIPADLLSERRYTLTVEVRAVDVSQSDSVLGVADVLSFEVRHAPCDPGVSLPATSGGVRPRLWWQTRLHQAA